MSKPHLMRVALWSMVLCAASPAAEPAPAPNPEQLSLWPDQAPVGDGQFEASAAALAVHRPPPGTATGAAMVICPGGGYGGLVTGPEGHGIAKWLNPHGIAGIVLEYRLPRGRPFVRLLDAQRAIRTVRFTAKAWGSIRVGSASSASRRAATVLWPQGESDTLVKATTETHMHHNEPLQPNEDDMEMD